MNSIKSTLPNFTTLQISSDLKAKKKNPLGLQIASELDKIKSKYSDPTWRYEPVSSHYRNTFVEMQNETFKKRLNLL